jgi:hypothetical protein
MVGEDATMIEWGQLTEIDVGRDAIGDVGMRPKRDDGKGI